MPIMPVETLAWETAVLQPAVLSVFCVLAGWHLWQERAFLSELAETLLDMATQRFWPPAPCHGSGSEEKLAEEAWLQEQMDELRVRSMRAMVKVVALMTIPGQCIVFYVWRHTGDDIVLERNIQSCVVVFLAVYAILLWARWLPMTAFRVKAINSAINIMCILRCTALEANHGFFFLQPTRFLFRAITGMITMDWRISCVLNTAWTVVLLYHEAVRMPRQLPHYQGNHFTILCVVGEVGSSTVLQALLWYTAFFAKSHICLNRGMDVATNVQKAVSRLLGVLCDAELRLTPSLEIHEPSPKVAHLLAPGEGAAGRAVLRKRNFEDFVAEGDRERARGFLASTSGSSDALTRPVASIQLHLCDTSGHRFPAELFHARLPSAAGREPDHLIGIRESSLPGCEAAAPAASRGLGRIVGGARAPEQGPGHAPSAGSGSRGGSSSSGSSSRSSAAAGAALLAEPAALEVRFDAMAQDMAVEKLHVRFKRRATAGKPRQLPRIVDWVDRSALESLEVWVQECVNAHWNEEEPPLAPDRPLLLRWPSSSLLLKPSHLSLELQEAGDDDAGSQPDEDADKEPEPTEGDADGEPTEDMDEVQLYGILRLEGLERVPKASCHRHRSSRSHGAQSVRSHGAQSARSHAGRGAARMAAIEEVPALLPEMEPGRMHAAIEEVPALAPEMEPGRMHAAIEEALAPEMEPGPVGATAAGTGVGAEDAPGEAGGLMPAGS